MHLNLRFYSQMSPRYSFKCIYNQNMYQQIFSSNEENLEKWHILDVLSKEVRKYFA